MQAEATTNDENLATQPTWLDITLKLIYFLSAATLFGIYSFWLMLDKPMQCRVLAMDGDDGGSQSNVPLSNSDILITEENDVIDVTNGYFKLFYSCTGVYAACALMAAIRFILRRHTYSQGSLLIGLIITIVSTILQLTIFLAMHVVRYSHQGKVCAGEFLPEKYIRMSSEQREMYFEQGYLLQEAFVLKIWIVFNWVFIGIGFCCICCAMCLVGRQKSQLEYGVCTQE